MKPKRPGGRGRSRMQRKANAAYREARARGLSPEQARAERRRYLASKGVK